MSEKNEKLKTSDANKEKVETSDDDTLSSENETVTEILKEDEDIDDNNISDDNLSAEELNKQLEHKQFQIDSLKLEIDTLTWENQIWDFNISQNSIHLLSAIMLFVVSMSEILLIAFPYPKLLL